jgi:predicted alpha/beta hydrolase family esterase
MKQQVVIIHGGNTYENYDSFLLDLTQKEVKLEDLRFIGWKDNLANDLGDGYEVLSPRMPNPDNAKFEEWRIWFEKINSLLDDNVILIGHSLGGIFLAKYLSENNSSKKIKALFLISAPHQLEGFTISTSIENISKQVNKIYIYHSKDDIVVPFENFEFYKKELPNAEQKIFEDKGHFHIDRFPELVENINELK